MILSIDRIVLLYTGKFTTRVEVNSVIQSTYSVRDLTKFGNIWTHSCSGPIYKRYQHASKSNTLYFIIFSVCALYPYFTPLQNGLDIEVDGRVHNVRGTVLVTLADTLAAHQLGGFKVGVGIALRKCRRCMATFDDMQSKVCVSLDWGLFKHALIILCYSSLRKTCTWEHHPTMTISAHSWVVHLVLLSRWHMDWTTVAH